MRKILLILGVVFLMAVQVVASNKVNVVDMDYVIKKLDTKAVIVDVRSEEVYNGKTPGRGIKGGHIPGAINIPLDIFMDKDDSEKINLLRSKKIDFKTEIITYCNTGRKSKVLAKELVRLGYLNVNNYKGSMQEWGAISTNKVIVK